ncbi:uncharacterized protein LOC133379976 isoform X2 [Rhineura floridana]|uniref:uncharacterized protein LOC133379976 isoform X2 n=1 Tax=Rhineura floridana TaxID=261503 RepID=UPI002AC87EE2|nr:uncharacterized protein LOC133379976 isoform X2 [Rhineura floridana]
MSKARLRKGHSREFQRLPLDLAIHNYRPGNWVRVKQWKKEPLLPTWGPEKQVALVTEAAVKVLGSDKWIHVSRIKRASEPLTIQEPEKRVAKDPPTGGVNNQEPEAKWSSRVVSDSDLKLKFSRRRDSL